MRSPRVGLIGARRVRQGLGPFVARDLVAAGAEVPCFLVSAESSIAPARSGLSDSAGVETRGYVDLDAMLARESLDAVAILSPPETHAVFLERAAGAGLSVLCEKPFVWGVRDLAARAERLVADLAGPRRVLFENCQWPFTLPTYERLYPGSLERAPERFWMELQPGSRGGQAIGDALSHPLSLLQAVVPGKDPQVGDISYVSGEVSPESLTVRFQYRNVGSAVSVEVLLDPAPAQPRRAAYALDGRLARRMVALEDYRLSLAGADRTLALADPLTLLVTRFVEALRAPNPDEQRVRARDITRRMKLLADLLGAYAEEDRR